MEKTLALFGIYSVSRKEGERIYKYAYTNNLFAKNMFIQYCQYSDESCTPPEYEFEITVLVFHATNVKDFSIFYETTLPVPPIDLWRRIVDVVTILEKVEVSAVEQYLEQISVLVLGSRDLRFDPDLQNNFIMRYRQKIEDIKKLIQQSKIDGN